MSDPVAARQMLGAERVIAGRVDPVQCVLNGGPETIRGEVRESYRQLGNPIKSEWLCTICPVIARFVC